jgi:hypothetical protein
MRLRRLIPLSGAIAGVALGCSGDANPLANCNNPHPGTAPSITVTASDSLSGRTLPDSLSGYFTGPTTDTLTFFNPSAGLALAVVPGYYTITLSHPGYQLWRRTVQVYVDVCGGAIPVTVNARMVVAP